MGWPEGFSLSKYRHGIVHKPSIEGVEIPPTPFLTLPFNKQDLRDSIQRSRNAPIRRRGRLYDITEGSFYSKREQQIHGKKVHAAIDYAVPYGTPVAAPVDGLAIATYFTYPMEVGSQPRVIDRKQLYFGFGYFVQIYNPETNRYVILGHLSDVHASIPFSKPVFDDGSWMPTNHNLPLAELTRPGNVVVAHVKRGDHVGASGWSGLAWGYTEYAGEDRPVPIDPSIFVSWDESHIHMEEAWRHPETGAKKFMRDPYDIYLTFGNYPTPTRIRTMGEEPLFLLGSDELPKYADDHI